MDDDLVEGRELSDVDYLDEAISRLKQSGHLHVRRQPGDVIPDGISLQLFRGGVIVRLMDERRGRSARVVIGRPALAVGSERSVLTLSTFGE